MTWLQRRLDELDYTHADLRKHLANKGIVRVRETITGWANGKPVSLLNDPQHAQILAETLNWTVLDMLNAAGFVSIPDELIAFIKEYQSVSPERKIRLIDGLQLLTDFFDNFTDEELNDTDED